MHFTLPITLTLAAASVLLHLWLAIRIGQVRRPNKIFVGDGGNEALTRRMRAHANFTENAALVLILVGALEASGKGGMPLWIASLVFIAARILHGFGMDGGKMAQGRTIGIILTFGVELVLAGWAVWTGHVAVLGGAA